MSSDADSLQAAAGARARARPLRSGVEVLGELVAVAGRTVVDVGCGDGGLVRWLAARGAQAIGIELSEAALARARASDPDHPGAYRVGSAQALPLADACADVVVFMLSLHHVPAEAMPGALSEARRVLRSDGVVYIAEPLAEGSFFELLRPVDDETAVRALAQDQIAAAPALGFRHELTIEFEARVRVPDHDHLRDRFVGADPRRAAAFDALGKELQGKAEALSEGEGDGDGEGWSFRQPMRADLLRRVD